MDSTVTKVLLDILLVVVSAGIGLLTIYLKKRWGVEKTKEIMAQVKVAIQAAELIGASLGWDGAAKKQWVVNEVSKAFKIDADDLNRFIESAVAELKIAGGELIKKTLKNGEEKVVLQYAQPPITK